MAHIRMGLFPIFFLFIPRLLGVFMHWKLATRVFTNQLGLDELTPSLQCNFLEKMPAASKSHCLLSVRYQFAKLKAPRISAFAG